jgi:hypothetical protein
MPPHRPSLALAVLVLAGSWAPHAAAGVAPTFFREAQLIASPPQASALFGARLAVSGDTAVVGAYAEDTDDGANAGAAYVFVRSGSAWTLQQKLRPQPAGPVRQFGVAVAVSGDTIVVGDDADQAYVFVRSGTTWTQQQQLSASEGAPGDEFGGAVAVSGDTAVIGAHASHPPDGAGAAYVFVRSGTTWTEQQKLTASDAAAADHFGLSLSLSGDTVAISAYADDTPRGFDAGSAYVFVRSGTVWTQQQKLTAQDGGADDWFGVDVSVSADTVVVGAPRDDRIGAADVGSAYVFVRSGTTWSQQQKLESMDGAADDFLGWSVAVNGNTAAVGAIRDDSPPAGLDVGSAYVFARTGTLWTEQQKLLSPDESPFARVGWAVSASGDTVLVGASGVDTGAEDAGSVYVFRKPARYFTLPACRAVDTRTAGPALAANSVRTFTLPEGCLVPPGARAIAANLVAVNPGQTGHLRVYPTGQPAPLASALNFAAGQTRANNAILSLGFGGAIDVQCDMPPGSTAGTHFVLDLFGYFRSE